MDDDKSEINSELQFAFLSGNEAGKYKQRDYTSVCMSVLNQTR